MFAWRESSNLTDLRRLIGYHEQALQLWYMTLMLSSLRRIEGGQEALQQQAKDLKAFMERYQRLDQHRVEEILRGLRRNDIRPLERELKKVVPDPDAVRDVLNDTVMFVEGSPIEQAHMKEHVKQVISSCETSDSHHTLEAKSHEHRFRRQSTPQIRVSEAALYSEGPPPGSIGRPKPSLFSPSLGYTPRPTSGSRPQGSSSQSRPRDFGYNPSPSDLPIRPVYGIRTPAEPSRKDDPRSSGTERKDQHYRGSTAQGTGANIVIVPQSTETAAPPRGILKRSVSTSARREPTRYIRTDNGEYIDSSQALTDSGQPLRFVRRRPVRSGYPSTRPKEDARNETESVIIETHDSSRDRERHRRRKSEAPPYRIIDVPRSPRASGTSGARLEVPDYSRDRHLDRVTVIEQDGKSQRRRSSSERTRSGAVNGGGNDNISTTATAGKDRPPQPVEIVMEPSTSRRSASKSRSQTRYKRDVADMQPRVEDASETSDREEIVIVRDRDPQQQRRRSGSKDREAGNGGSSVRSSSTRSWVRRRRRTSSHGSSAGDDDGGAGVRILKIDKMDRIDSMGT